MVLATSLTLQTATTYKSAPEIPSGALFYSENEKIFYRRLGH